MTTGNWTRDGRFFMTNTPGYGASYGGPYESRAWSGGDAITASTPRSSYPRAVGPRPGQARKRPTLPPQNYSLTVNQQYVGFYWAKPNSDEVIVSVQPTSPSDISSPAPVDPKQVYKLIAKLREEIYGSDFNPAVFLAEGRQALGMISNAAERIGSGICRLKARDPHGVLEALGLEPNNRFSKGLRDRSKSLSSSWLEVQYGWLPLLKDAESAAKWIAEAIHGNYPMSVRKQKTWSESVVSGAAGLTSTDLSTRVDIFELQIIASRLRARSAYLPTIATVASVAWEKLPYSFVADWFVPVGGYIEAIRTKQDLDGQFVQSLKQTTVWHTLVAAPWWRMQTDQPINGLPTFLKRIQFNRTVSEELIVPPPWNEETAKDLLEYKSWRHAANAVALLTQRNWQGLYDKLRKK